MTVEPFQGHSLRISGRAGKAYSGGTPVADLLQWSLERTGPGRFTFIADQVQYDVTRWPFRDVNAPVTVELPMRRSTQRFCVMLTSEQPFAGDATLDANKAEAGDFW
jgi:hypothetical protein